MKDEILLIASLLLTLVFIYHIYRYMTARSKTISSDDPLSKCRRTIRELNIINELSASLLSSLEMDDVIDMLLNKSKELLKANRSAVILLDKKGNLREFYTSMGPSPGCKIRLTGILQKVYIEMAPVRGNNITDLTGFNGFPKNHPDIGGIIIVPIFIRDEIIGELIITDRADGKEFTADDEDLLMTIAFHCAFALEKVNLHNKVLKMATTDGLTGLKNHRAFQERMTEEIERYKRYGHSFSLIMLDIDHFKEFNDTFGHQVGDEALKAISKIMEDTIRGNDMAARYGGEEFAIVLMETRLEEALRTAERIRQEIEKYELRIDGTSQKITISAGVSTFPEDGLTREDVIEAADKALYLSKRSGRNRVSAFRED